MGGGPTQNYHTGVNEQLQITLRYKDENAGDEVIYNPLQDDTFKNVYASEADLGKFLERPVLIQSFGWQEGTSLNTAFFPWHDFFNNAKIKNKIENYTFLQANLKIKLIVNASPFFYGAGLLAYEPLPQYNPAPIAGATLNGMEVIGHSQRPHFWFYPANSQGGSMTLPFINKEDWLDITNATTTSNMGKMRLISPNDLMNANGISGQSVSIQIFAWAEDVRLCGPTMSAAMQSDEYSTEGIISKPASAVAEAASLLTSVPVIGPYMTATSFIASTVSSVASWFGWTNCPVISDVQPYKDLPFHGLASAEIGQPVEKLTLDPKNELTVDPRTIGLAGDDELIIKSLVTKESYIGTSIWSQVDAADLQLFAAVLKPEYYQEETISSVVYHQATPLSWLSHMFQYWRGDIIFRFRFICSKYHKGRVIFSWDPDYNISGVTPGSATTNFSRIVDISEEPDVEIRCNYMQATTFLRTEHNRGGDISFDTTAVNAHDGRHDNGILTMRVFTQQTSPVSSADVQVLVSVRGAENLEFAAPKEISNSYAQYVTQAEELEYGAPPLVELTGDGTGAEDTHTNLVYMGETMKSLRQLLRRTSLSRVDAFTSDTTNLFSTIKCLRGRYPLIFGYDTNGVDVSTGLISATNENFNFVSQHPINWVRMCYIGSRGSIRWQYNVSSTNVASNLRVKRLNGTRVVGDYAKTVGIATTASQDTIVRSLLTEIEPGSTGQSLINQRTQTGLAVEYPMYSRFRMMANDASTNTLGATNDDSDVDSISLTSTSAIVDVGATANPRSTLLYSYASIGTDYTCLYFLNVPTLYYYSSYPAAV